MPFQKKIAIFVVTESFTDDNVTTMPKKLYAMLVLLVLALPATAQRTSTMGWSSWNAFASDIDMVLNKGDNTVTLWSQGNFLPDIDNMELN